MNTICTTRIAVGLSAMLLLAPGCRGPAPHALAPAQRVSLGTVGVYSVDPPPVAAVTGPIGVGAQRLKGAAKGGGIGLAAGVGGGALTGAGLGLACGPFALVCSPIFAAWGAAIGGAGGLLTGGTIGVVQRGANAIPTAVADRGSAALAAVVAGRDLQTSLRERVLAIGHDADPRPIDLGGDATTVSVSPTAYDRFAADGVQVVLEVGLERLALTGKGGDDPVLTLVMTAHARAIDIVNGRELWRNDRLLFESPAAHLSAWLADDSARLSAELERGLGGLARSIGDAVLPPPTLALRTRATS